jgi:hypothetical protein
MATENIDIYDGKIKKEKLVEEEREKLVEEEKEKQVEEE